MENSCIWLLVLSSWISTKVFFSHANGLALVMAKSVGWSIWFEFSEIALMNGFVEILMVPGWWFLRTLVISTSPLAPPAGHISICPILWFLTKCQQTIDIPTRLRCALCLGLISMLACWHTQLLQDCEPGKHCYTLYLNLYQHVNAVTAIM